MSLRNKTACEGGGRRPTTEGTPTIRGALPGLSKRKLIVVGILLAFLAQSGRGVFAGDEDAMYFQIQSRVIQASIAQEFEVIRDKGRSKYVYYPHYLSNAFHYGWDPRPWDDVYSYEFYGPLLASENSVTLVYTDSGYRVHEMTNGNEIDIFAKTDWDTIHALARDCNTLLEQRGRLACEFDGGYDGGGGYSAVLLPHT